MKSISTTSPILYYSVEEESFPNSSLPFHVGFLDYCFKNGENLAYIIPKQADKWTSTESIVLLGRAWLQLTRFNTKLSLRIQILIPGDQPEIRKIVPNMIMEICTDPKTFLPKEQVKTHLSDASFTEQPVKRVKLESAEKASINQLKLQKSYLDWIPDPDSISNSELIHHTVLGYGSRLGASATTLESLMKSPINNFYGRKHKNGKI